METLSLAEENAKQTLAKAKKDSENLATDAQEKKSAMLGAFKASQKESDEKLKNSAISEAETIKNGIIKSTQDDVDKLKTAYNTQKGKAVDEVISIVVS